MYIYQIHQLNFLIQVMKSKLNLYLEVLSIILESNTDRLFHLQDKEGEIDQKKEETFNTGDVVFASGKIVKER